MRALPAVGSEPHDVRAGKPRASTARGVQPVAADQACARVGQVLQDLGDKLGGGEDFGVGAEVVVVGGMVDDGIRASLVHEKLLQREGRPYDVLRERLAGLEGTRGDADGSVNGEAGVSPIDHAPRQSFVQELPLQEERDDPLAEPCTHLREVHDGEVDESPLLVEPSLQEKPVPVRVPSSEFPRALEHDDAAGADLLARGCHGEIPYKPIDESADLAVKPAVVTEEHPQHLGHGEDELPMRQQLLIHVLAEQEGPFLGAGGTEVEYLAGEGSKVFGPASRVGAMDARDPLGVVAALKKPLHSLGEPIQAEPSHTPGVVRLVSCREARKVGTEQTLERAGAPLPVCSGWRRIQEQRQLLCHKGVDGLKSVPLASCGHVRRRMQKSGKRASATVGLRLHLLKRGSFSRQAGFGASF